MATLEAGLVLDELRFLLTFVLNTHCLLGTKPAHALGGRLDVFGIPDTELLHAAAVLVAVKRSYARIGKSDSLKN